MKYYNIKQALIFCLSLLLLLIDFKGISQEKYSDKEIDVKANQYFKILSDLDRFSGSVLIARNGKIIFNHSYGYANREHDVLNENFTKYRIASITKQFTSMAIMMLQEQKKIDVQDHLCKYLSDCPEIWKEITINNLLTMTSGIPEYTDFPDYHKTRMIPLTLDDFIGSFKNKKLEFIPGEKFQYSNSNYILLGQIIENITGKPYRDFLQERIFTPLEMNNTGLYDEKTILKHRAEGYIFQNDKFEHISNATFLNGYSAGGLYSTTEDLLKWDLSLYNTNLISTESLEKIFTPLKGDYASGWFVGKKFNRKWISHTGAIPGYRNQISRFPDEKLTIIILNNLDNTDIESLTQDAAAIVYGESYKLPKSHLQIKVDPKIYNDYIGQYDFPNAPFTVLIESNKLIGELHGRKAEMIPYSASEFYIKQYDIEIKFLRNTQGKVDGLLWEGKTKINKIK